MAEYNEEKALDYPYNIASEKIIRHLMEAEVMSIFFPRIGKTLIVDTRHDYENGPTMILDGMVQSPEERLRSIKRLRPQFEQLGQLTLAPWVGSTRSFVERGILDAVIARFQSMGYGEAANAAHATFRSLRRAERDMMRDLASGEPRTTRTLWQRS